MKKNGFFAMLLALGLCALSALMCLYGEME